MPGARSRIESRPASAAVTATRPVYPYPAVAKYTGTGDWHDAANHGQRAPLHTASTPAWTGSSFCTPYVPRRLERLNVKALNFRG